MSSFSEYGRLRTIVLGTVEDYKPACWGWKSDNVLIGANFTQAIEISNSAIPLNIIEEVMEDLDEFEKTLINLEVEVIRPPRFESEPIHETEFFYSYGQDFYNMRDLHIVLGNQILSSAPSQPNRLLEIKNLYAFFSALASKFKMELIQSPTPRLVNNVELPYFRDQVGNLVSFEEKLAPELGSVTSEIWHRLSESEILFDAANLMRFESEALYLVSSTGNYQAFQWLKSNSNNFKIEATDVYRSSHLDSTILPLNSETVLVNSVRVNPNNIPKSLMTKNILYFNDVANISQSEGNFHNNYRSPAAKKLENLGFHTNLKEMSSPWAGMNVLSLDENTVLVESTQGKLAQFLESKGFDVILVRMRHPYTMLGGLHCTTLDLVRDHK